MGAVRDLFKGVKALMFKDSREGHALGVVLSDGSGNGLLVDEYGALVAIPWVHYNVHEQLFYDCVYKTPDGGELADNASLWLLLITGNKPFHFEFLAVAGGDAEIHLYEGVSASASGTALPVYNLYRPSTNAFSGLIFHTPTFSASGTDIYPGGLLPGGVGGQTPGGLVRLNAERELKTNTGYAVRIVNRAGTAQPASITIEGYEENE